VFKRNLSLLLVFLLTSCSAIERNFNVDTSRYTKSSLGAAAGAAIGATAGTIIGSTSGDAGKGFLLGGGLGALSGAVIGTEMDSREERAYARSTINRQNSDIQNQNQRLNTIRNNSFDGGYGSGSYGNGSYDNGNYGNGNYGNGNYGGANYNSGQGASISGGDFDASGQFVIPSYNTPSASYSGASANRTYAAARQIQSSYIVESDLGSTPSLPQGNTTNRIVSSAPVITAPIAVAPKIRTAKKARASLKPNTKTYYNNIASRKASASKIKSFSNSNIPLAKTLPVTQVEKVNSIPLAQTFPIDKPSTQVLNSAKSLVSKASGAVASTAVSGSGIINAAAIPLAKVLPATTAPIATTASGIRSGASQLAKSVSGDGCSDAEGEAGRARAAATDTDKIFYYRRALRLCKSKPDFHIEIGKVYASIGRKEEAEFEFSKALEIDPNNSEAQDELTILMLDGVN